MTKNEKDGTENGENPKIELPLNTNEVLEKLQFLVAKTEKIENSQKQKFDEMSEKFQSIAESVSKNSKFDDDEKKTMMKFEKQLESLEKSIFSNNENKKEQKSEKKFVLKHVFENVENLEENQIVTSKGVAYFNAHWRIKVQRYRCHLGFFVICEPIDPIDEEWSIETNLELRMMGNDDFNAIKTMKYFFDNEEIKEDNDFLWEHFEFYLIDDNLTVEVEVEIVKMTGFERKRIRKFDESQKDVSDVILVVQDTKFYVQKMFLALQSTFFKALFLGNFEESEKKEIELKDIDPDDFQNFLELIHGESSVDDDTVTGILQLADMYDTPTAIRRCEEFLMEKSKKNNVQKLQLALRCNLENLKSKCLSEITTISDIQSIMKANFPEMDVSTSQALLQKALDFSNK